jgi:hypothetical protein
VQFLNLTKAGAALEEAEVFGVASTGELDGSALAEAVGVAFTGTVTPLFQVSLDPDLIHVNFLLPTTWASPAFAHLAPGFAGVAAYAEDDPAIRITMRMALLDLTLFICSPLISSALISRANPQPNQRPQ